MSTKIKRGFFNEVIIVGALLVGEVPISALKKGLTYKSLREIPQGIMKHEPLFLGEYQMGRMSQDTFYRCCSRLEKKGIVERRAHKGDPDVYLKLREDRFSDIENYVKTLAYALPEKEASMEGIISHLSQLYAFWRISNPYTQELLPFTKKLINPKQLREEVKKTKASTGKLVQAEMALDILERLVQSDSWRFYINIFHILTELDTKGEFPSKDPGNAPFCKKVEKIFRERKKSGKILFSS